MWPTNSGLRQLSGDEAALVRGAIGAMVDQLVAEGRGKALQNFSYIDWYDNWDPSQRLWLLDVVAIALLTPAEPPEPAAMLEATVDAIFAKVLTLIECDIDHFESEEEEDETQSWRQNAIDAFVYQNGHHPTISRSEQNCSKWDTLVTQLADAILGVRIYLQAEDWRDGDPSETARFLMQKGVPANFLDKIPPLQTADQTKVVVDRIQRLVFGDLQ